MGVQAFWRHAHSRLQMLLRHTCTPLRRRLREHQPIIRLRQLFNTFAELNAVLGFHMKKSKKQPPATQHKIQGVIIKCSDQHITVQPCPQRVQRLTELQNHIQSKSMSPEQARRLAGKCSFTTTHLFGRVGRSPLRALYMTRQVLLHNRQNQHTHTHKDSHHRTDRDTCPLPTQDHTAVT